jgi:transcriptional regulator with XRE-family HTH domain
MMRAMPNATKAPATRGGFLRFLRKRAGLSLRQLADKVGKSHVAVGDAERDKRSSVALETAIACAESCGATTKEVRRLRALDALHNQALPLDEGMTEADVVVLVDAMETLMKARPS